MRITFLTESLENNSLGRTFSLWLLAQELGWQSEIVSSRGADVWAPLSGTEFADHCYSVPPAEVSRTVHRECDLLVACKPLEQSLGIALRVGAERRLPILVDIDDPDLEAMMRVGRPVQRAARAIRRPGRTLRDLRYRKEAVERPSIVSNPWLHARYGGTLIPHARVDQGSGDYSSTDRPGLVFVGTNRTHKGVGVLREATARLQEIGFTLTVTDVPPHDAKSWEAWVGQTTLADGASLVKGADIVALPSLHTRQAEGQLPAKLIDAMLLGRAVVVTDVDPMPWAVGDTGLIVKAGSVDELTNALDQLRDPGLRRSLGIAARRRALAEFTVGPLSERFREACAGAVDAGWNGD